MKKPRECWILIYPENNQGGRIDDKPFADKILAAMTYDLNKVKPIYRLHVRMK